MSLMVALEFLVLFLFSLPHDAVGTGKMEFKLIKFEYPDESIKQLLFKAKITLGSQKYHLEIDGKNNPLLFPEHLTHSVPNPIIYQGTPIQKIHLEINVLAKNGKKKLDSVRQQFDITPDNKLRPLTIHTKKGSTLNISYRVVCDRHYYDRHCDKHCYPHDNDDDGHFSCDPEGRKRCRKGWKDPWKDCRIRDVPALPSSSAPTWSSFQIVVMVLVLLVLLVLLGLILFFCRATISQRIRECFGRQGPGGPSEEKRQPSNDTGFELDRLVPAKNRENEQRDVRSEGKDSQPSTHQVDQEPSRLTLVIDVPTSMSFRGIDSYVMDKQNTLDKSINHKNRQDVDELRDDHQVRIEEAKCDGVEEAMGAAPVALVARYIGIEDYIEEENEAIAVTVAEDGNGGSESLRSVHNDNECYQRASDDKCKEGNEIGRVNSDADENSDSAQRMGQIEKKEMHADPLAKRELKKILDLILLDKALKNVYAVAFLWLLLESSPQFNLIKVQQIMIASLSVYWCYMISIINTVNVFNNTAYKHERSIIIIRQS